MTDTAEAVNEHAPCCSSHKVDMTCERYRLTHFVEVRPCCSIDAAALADETAKAKVAHGTGLLVCGDCDGTGLMGDGDDESPYLTCETCAPVAQPYVAAIATRLATAAGYALPGPDALESLMKATLACEVRISRQKAAEKHGGQSIESLDKADHRWLSILVEEVGETSHELTYDSEGSLRAELIDVLAVASAWVDSLDRRDARGTGAAGDGR